LHIRASCVPRELPKRQMDKHQIRAALSSLNRSLHHHRQDVLIECLLELLHHISRRRNCFAASHKLRSRHEMPANYMFGVFGQTCFAASYRLRSRHEMPANKMSGRTLFFHFSLSKHRCAHSLRFRSRSQKAKSPPGCRAAVYVVCYGKIYPHAQKCLVLPAQRERPA